VAPWQNCLQQSMAWLVLPGVAKVLLLLAQAGAGCAARGTQAG